MNGQSRRPMKHNRRSYTWPMEQEPTRDWFFQFFDALEAVAAFLRGRQRP